MRPTRKRSNFNGRRSGGYRQPSLYSRTEETKERGTRHFPTLLVFIIALGGLIYMVFFSGIFSVQKIELSKTRFIDRGGLLEKLNSTRGPLDNNIITFGFFGISSRLEQVTGIEKVSIKRVSQHDVLVEIVEKAPLLVWQTSGGKYLVDEDGVAWAQYEDKYASLPVVIDTKNLPVTLGSKILTPNFVAFFKDMSTTFESTTAVKITKLEVMDILSDLKVTTSAGWYVFFDTNHVAKTQINNLSRVLGQVQGGKMKLEYVDLRIENRIFYK